MTLTEQDPQLALTLIIERFAATPDANIWARYPAVSRWEDEHTDDVACLEMSQAFIAAVRAAGLMAWLVGADGPDGGHYWAQAEGLNVDWTARQFHNLEFPPNPAHQNLPCPLIWTGLLHPVATFTTIEGSLHGNLRDSADPN